MECPSPERLKAEVGAGSPENASHEFWLHLESCRACRECLLEYGGKHNTSGNLVARLVSDASQQSGCPSAEALSDFAAGRLPAQESEQLGLHVQACQACSADIVDLRSWLAEMGRLQRQAFYPKPRLSFGDWLSLRTQRLCRQSPLWNAVAAGTAAVAIIVLGIGFMLLSSRPQVLYADTEPFWIWTFPKLVIGAGFFALMCAFALLVSEARHAAVRRQHAWLEIVGPDRERILVLDRKITSIGRMAENVLVLPDPEVSRRHARICWTGKGFVAVDLTSSNGTLVNGVAVESALISDGDCVRIGSWTLRFRQGK